MTDAFQASGRHRTDTRMRYVLLALMPGSIALAVMLDIRVLSNIVLAVITAWSVEAIVMKLRARAALAALRDGSITVMAVLLAVAVTPLLPWWQLMLGTAFGALLGKHVYGGLGQNVFNPAMVGFAMLLVSFPQTMSQWPDSAMFDQHDGIEIVDGTTAATPLDHAHRLAVTATATVANESTSRRHQLLHSPWPLISIAWLAGGLFLLWRGVIDWRVPLSMLATLALLHTLQLLLSPQSALGPLAGLLAGASLLGAFFIATDPVTSPASPPMRLVYGAGIGTFTFFIREFSSYPEGVAFAVLLMNLCAPALDRWQAGPSRS